MSDREALKAAAAARALELIRPGMVVGLGTGTTSAHFIHGLARRVQQGLDIVGVPSSRATSALATRLGIPVLDDWDGTIDIAVDGADEIDPQLRLIKGRGGALTREKIVAAAARRFVVIADDSKLVPRLGVGVLPVEILPLLWTHTRRRLEALGATAQVRHQSEIPFETDNGNPILDLRFPQPIADPVALDWQLTSTVGVVGHGLFVHLTHTCIVAGADGVRVIEPRD